MDHPKKVLILYASAGHGHEKAAKAIYEACQELPGEPITAKIADTILLASSFYGNLYRQSYLMQIKYTPWLWGIFYYSLDQDWIYGWMRWLRRLLNSVTARRLERLIIEENPSTIITTHFLSTEVTSRLKENGKTNARIINVVTDYMPHHIWLAKFVDIYVVALRETKEQLVKWGVPPDKIKVLGIPIEKKFMASVSSQEARLRLSLDPVAFTLLITSGGAGIGSMKNVIENLLRLKKPIQILAVCGTNKALFEGLSLKAKKYPMLKIFGFVNNMNELMAASDIVIGKGGGLTITESFSQGKPMILFQSIPGQEARNAACVQKYKAGFVADSLNEIVRKVDELLESPDELDSIRKGVREMYMPDTAGKIACLASD